MKEHLRDIHLNKFEKSVNKVQVFQRCLFFRKCNVFFTLAKFKFQVQDSDLEYLFWQFEKHITDRNDFEDSS